MGPHVDENVRVRYPVRAVFTVLTQETDVGVDETPLRE